MVRVDYPGGARGRSSSGIRVFVISAVRGGWDGVCIYGLSVRSWVAYDVCVGTVIDAWLSERALNGVRYGCIWGQRRDTSVMMCASYL